jgi:hypothetical protein
MDLAYLETHAEHELEEVETCLQQHHLHAIPQRRARRKLTTLLINP